MPRPPLCFELIKSLEKAEKIHFKRHLPNQSSKGEPTIYVKLFDELDKMKEYDVERLKRKFKGEKFTKHLSASLSFLYGSLLNSLVDYHTKKDDELRADEMIGEIRILFQKRLYKQCTRQITSARKFFEEREYHQHLYKLCAYEYNLITKQMPQDEIEELKRVNKERRAYLRKLDDELLIFDLSDQLTPYHREKQLNLNQDFTGEIVDIIYQLKDLEDRFEEGSMTFKLFYTRTKERLYYIKSQPIKSLQSSHRYVRIRRDLPEKLRYSQSADLNEVGNHITKSIEMWFVDEVEYWLPELEIIATQNKNLRHRVDLMNWHFRFQLLLLRGQVDKLTDLVGELMNTLDVLQEKNVAYYRVLLFEDLALYHFLTDNFEESLEWINRIFEEKDTDDWVRKLTINSHLMEITAHFNLGNYRLIPSLCLSFERAARNLEHGDNEFVEEIKWARKMKRLGKYILPRQMNDFIETLLPEGYFAIPPNYRIVLMSVWAQAHHKKISLNKSWGQHAENIITEMKSTTGMDSLCFEEKAAKNPMDKVLVNV